ncbi:hypothetical protein [Pseudomonas sp. 58 R 12]|uniref:hypothetical protein n=1 Tax=Pseudomonas sp. 58 R 12 TaxID=1844107 RepID=UPI0008127521|nr:hypothetical protein [Pseudomonas sp. 58 R 12]CRM70541.1 hypothetical protein [Pseudomonas sp. 58 R 12]
MKRSDVVLLAVFSVGFFSVGVVWRPAFGTYGNIKDGLECVSYIATTVAAIVAIFALSAWKAQFKYSEKFKSINILNDSAVGLLIFSHYIVAMTSQCMEEKFKTPSPIRSSSKKIVDNESLWGALNKFKLDLAVASLFLTKSESSEISACADRLERAHRKWLKKFHECLLLSEYNAEPVELVVKWITEINEYLGALQEKISIARKSSVA